MLRSLLLLNLVLIHLTTAATLFAEAPPASEPAVSPKAARALHQRLEELDRDLRQRLERIARGRTPLAEERLRGEARSWRRELLELERESAALRQEEAHPLKSKIRQLENLVANLENAAAGADRARALPRLPERRPMGSSSSLISAPSPTNDACANATPASLDSVTLGDTSLATQDGVATCGSSLFSPDVWIDYTAATSGLVSLDTLGSDFDTVISVQTACPGIPDNQIVCNDDAFGVQSAALFYAYAGEHYRIRVSGFGGATGSFELRLGQGGAVAGTVTDASTGDPIVDGEVRIYDQQGYWYGSAQTDVAGQFAAGGLAAGTYFLKADADGYLDELFDDVSCALGCSVTAGTPVAVPSLGEVAGLDFALEEDGEISGIVTHSATGDPVAGVRVEIYDSGGSFVADRFTDAAGAYEVGGLPSGSYFALAQSPDYQNELYDDIPCAGGCDPTTGTAIPVAASQTKTGVDFALDRLGVVTGVVTEAATGDPISGAYVNIYSSSGFNYYGYTYSDDTGVYSMGGLPDGSYVAVTDIYGTYVNQVYDSVDCSGAAYSWSCDLAAGTPFAVAVNTIAAGVDFSLDKFGVITGTVTDAVTGDPIYSLELEIWNDQGFVDWGYPDGTGTFSVPGLSPGTYYAKTNTYNGYLDELYRELPCTGGTCDATTGTAIPVSLNATASGIDFTLDPGGSISGAVTDATTGDPIAYASISIWDSSGSLARSGSADFVGNYSLDRLESGTYFVTAQKSNYRAELYDDLPCPGGPPAGCDPTTGSAVAVTLNADTSGIDFALDLLGTISGIVTDGSTGDALYGNISIWDAAGTRVASTTSYYSDGYSVSLPAGTYYATATNSDYFSELYQDIPCGGCDPTTGTPIAVTLGVATTSIDFSLGHLGTISGIVTDLEGAPLSDIVVEIRNAEGGYIGDYYTYSNGLYSFSYLEPGSYYLATRNYQGYLDEIFDNIPCLEDNCDPTKGTAVTVAVDQTVQVDFELALSGVIGGRVTNEATGYPVPGVTVRAWNVDGQRVDTATADASGDYLLQVGPGIFYVSTSNSLGLLDEVYAGVGCASSCDPLLGTPIPVGLEGNGLEVTGIDFALGEGPIFADGFESGDVSAWN